MAKYQIVTHPKFAQLVMELKLPPAYVLGHLEMLYISAQTTESWTYHTSARLEASAGWQGKPGALTKALLKCRLIDKAGRERYALHDYLDHAPDYVRRRIARREEKPAPKRPSLTDNDGQSPPMSAYRSPITEPKERQIEQHRSDDRAYTAQDSFRNGKDSQNAQQSPLAGPEGEKLLKLYFADQGYKRAAATHLGERTDWGAKTKQELALTAAALDVRFDPERAKKLWHSRCNDLERCPGGLDFLRQCLSDLSSLADYRNPRRVKPKDSPIRWLNKITSNYVAQHLPTIKEAKNA